MKANSHSPALSASSSGAPTVAAPTDVRPAAGVNFKQLRKDFVTCISLANLAFLRLWSELLGVKRSDGYSMRLPPRPVDLEAAMLNVCLLGVLLCIAATLVRRTRHGRAVIEWAFLLFFLLPLNAVRALLAGSVFPVLGGALTRSDWHWNIVVLGATGGGLTVWLTVGARGRLLRFASAVPLVLSPFVLVTFSRAALQVAHYDPAAYADKKMADRVGTGQPPRRVLWLVFDEMDQRLAFVNRRPGLQMPEMDRLSGESFSATEATSPSRQTLDSLPALLTGKPVKAARALGPDDLLLDFADGSTGHLQTERNVFSRARDAGFDTAVAGWYHPYCRVLNQSLTECAWSEYDYPSQYNSRGATIPEVARNQVRSLEIASLSPFGQPLISLHHVRTYRDVLAAGTAFASDPRLGFVLIHFPIPHSPYVYDSRTGRLDRTHSDAAGYGDALELADLTLGRLRRTMEDAGVWDRTAVLISADHGYRASTTLDRGKADRRVPFLLKLPGQRENSRYDLPLETIHTADLLLQVLEGRIQTAAGVSAWLQERP